MGYVQLSINSISLPISNIELKPQQKTKNQKLCISLPISNIELKPFIECTVSMTCISLPISNIELKLPITPVLLLKRYQFTYIQH